MARGRGYPLTANPTHRSMSPLSAPMSSLSEAKNLPSIPQPHSPLTQPAFCHPRRAPIVAPHPDAGPVPTVGRGTGAATTYRPQLPQSAFSQPVVPSIVTPHSVPRLPALRCGAGTHGGRVGWQGHAHPTTTPLPKGVACPVLNTGSCRTGSAVTPTNLPPLTPFPRTT